MPFEQRQFRFSNKNVFLHFLLRVKVEFGEHSTFMIDFDPEINTALKAVILFQNALVLVLTMKLRAGAHLV